MLKVGGYLVNAPVVSTCTLWKTNSDMVFSLLILSVTNSTHSCAATLCAWIIRPSNNTKQFQLHLPPPKKIKKIKPCIHVSTNLYIFSFFPACLNTTGRLNRLSINHVTLSYVLYLLLLRVLPSRL